MKRKKTVTLCMSRCGNTVVIADFRSGFQIHLKRLGDLVLILLKQMKLKRTVLSLVFISDSAIRHLNQRYLDHPWPTDVLAFPFSHSVGGELALQNRSFLGEVIVSPKRAEVYSKRLNVSFEEEFIRYICHGILHLQGYTDKSYSGKTKMRRAEDRLLKIIKRKMNGII